jgi:ferredoxin
MEGEYPVFNAEKCTGCGQCLAGLCPVDAMHS